MGSQNENYDIYELLILLLENDLTDSQQDYLIEWSQKEPDAVKIYHEFLRSYSIICSEISGRVEQKYGASADTHFDNALWAAMAKHEKTAPTIEIPKGNQQRELIQKVVYPPREKRKMSKFHLVFLVMNVAAILFFVLFIKFVPPKTGIEVATLVDSIDAVWNDQASSLQIASRLVNGRDEYTLHEGMAKLLFDNSAKVVIEAPAEFKLSSEDHVELLYGRLYTKVPPEAIGFTVSTLSAEIVDLGTEFGVEVDYVGDTSLHVIKGKTSLVAGDKSKQPAIRVEAGSAKRVSADTEIVSDVPCDNDRFIRDIDSSNHLVWRGEPTQWYGYIDWTAESGNWSDGANWDIGNKPDGTREVRLRNGNTSVCTLNTIEAPINSRFSVSNGQTFNIEDGGYMGCGWARFEESIVNMTGNGTWLLNDDDMYIGYPSYGRPCECIWTMYDDSKIAINVDADDGEVIYISQDNARGTLKLVGSNVTVNCDQLYVGYPRTAGFSPYATLEYVMDAKGASTIHVGYRIWLSEGDATSHLVLSASESLPKKDIVLIENSGDQNKIWGDGAFDTMNGGPASEGTRIPLGGNQYLLTYRYEANGDGNQNDIALVFQSIR